MALFKPGDVVWAKMRGHPPWPAVILQAASQLTGVPSGRYSVKFYGTYETAIMRSADLFDFVKNRAQFEVRRENKGFMLAVQEARQAVGLSNDLEREEASLARSNATPSTSHTESGGRRRSTSRPRRPSSRFNTGDYVLQPLRGRVNSQSHHVLESPQKTKSKGTKNEKKSAVTSERRLKESANSINDHRKRTISAYFELDVFNEDPMLTPVITDGFNNPLLDGFHTDVNCDSGGFNGVKQSKRTPKPKVFEDFILPGRSRTPSRERNNSTSSSGRTRLISGVSDILEELEGQFDAAGFMSVLNDFDDDRPLSPEEPLPMPAPNKYCSDCACLCELHGLKWRCTNKSCLKWNGTHDPYGQDNEFPDFKSEDFRFDQPFTLPETSSTSLPEPDNMFGGNENLKLDPPKLETCGFKTEPEMLKPFDSETTPVVSGPMQEQQASVPAESTFPAFENGLGMTVSAPQPVPNVKEPPVNNLPSVLQTSNTNFNTTLPRRQLGAGRPKSYKVEKTPPVTENGQRLCAFCGGQVRPQMCGGNKHRWRCVDKKCRKWYGWVRSNEEIPKDLGKKGRWKDLALKIKRKGVNEEDNGGLANGGCDTNNDVNLYISNAVPLCERQSKKLGRPPKPRVGKVKLKIKKKNGNEPNGLKEGERPKRKYTKREKPAEEVRLLRYSPLPPEVLSFRPSAMEKRGRWWISEKRRHDVSPEKDWNARSPLDTAAAMHVLAQSMRVAANTLADEQGTINGSLDLLMDALMSSLAPLLSLTTQLPTINLNDDVLQQMWNASSVHTPIFS